MNFTLYLLLSRSLLQEYVPPDVCKRTTDELIDNKPVLDFSSISNVEKIKQEQKEHEDFFGHLIVTNCIKFEFRQFLP